MVKLLYNLVIAWKENFFCNPWKKATFGPSIMIGRGEPGNTGRSEKKNDEG